MKKLGNFLHKRFIFKAQQNLRYIYIFPPYVFSSVFSTFVEFSTICRHFQFYDYLRYTFITMCFRHETSKNNREIEKDVMYIWWKKISISKKIHFKFYNASKWTIWQKFSPNFLSLHFVFMFSFKEWRTQFVLILTACSIRHILD